MTLGKCINIHLLVQFHTLTDLILILRCEISAFLRKFVVMQTSDNSYSLFQAGPPQLVEVLLPLPLEATFTYRIPPETGARVDVGYRVIVPFGRKKFYTGIVTGLPSKAPEGMELKDVAMVLDNHPVVRHPQLKLWKWIADYYLCAEGDVLKAALPAGMKIESETFVEFNPDMPPTDMPDFTEVEAEIVQLLQHENKGLSVNTITSRLEGRRGVTTSIHRLIESGVLIISEKLVERYRVKHEAFVGFAFPPDATQEAFAKLKGAPKQEQLLLAMLQLTGYARGGASEISREALMEKAAVTPAILQTVAKKGVLRLFKKEINRFRFTGTPTRELPQLSAAQSKALDEIHRSWLTKQVTLLHGVTSSGKTEIYIHLIDFVLRRGEQALMLVPEIALTTQLTRRLQSVFGDRVIIYHSRFTDNERVDIWKRLLHDSSPVVVLGPRSAVFLPFAKLGLVIVDEEHEQSYKQFDPAPRYHGRDVATVLASMHGARTLLGSATPAIDTYYKAKEGKFGLVELTERYGAVELPTINIVDMKAAQRAKAVSGTFAIQTRTMALEALRRGAQVIMFQNRRGYAPLTRCRQCAWVPRCEQCDVALTYHSHLRQLQCHYCGAVYPLPTVCPQCHEPSIDTLGYGTERIEEEVEQLFQGHKMLRMDLDTTRNKNSYSQIIDDFSERRASILVGTQMVTKGLDFGGVEMVAVLNADSIINYPDFRSAERAFCMLEQVAGRAGRRAGAPGNVVVQTYQPTHPVLRFVSDHNYAAYFAYEIDERRRFTYPPFSRIIYIYLKHRDPAALRFIAEAYAGHLRQLLGNRVFGPEEPTVSRVQGLYIRKIMLKVETSASMPKVKELLRQTYISLHAHPQMKGVTLYYDVDPQ